MDKHLIGQLLALPVLAIGFLIVPAVSNQKVKLALIGLQLTLLVVQIYCVFS